MRISLLAGGGQLAGANRIPCVTGPKAPIAAKRAPPAHRFARGAGERSLRQVAKGGRERGGLPTAQFRHSRHFRPEQRRSVTTAVDEFTTIPGADYEQVFGELAKY
jgi:hypothetical protein